jgi:hypothetical protein
VRFKSVPITDPDAVRSLVLYIKTLGAENLIKSLLIVEVGVKSNRADVLGSIIKAALALPETTVHPIRFEIEAELKISLFTPSIANPAVVEALLSKLKV